MSRLQFILKKKQLHLGSTLKPIYKNFHFDLLMQHTSQRTGHLQAYDVVRHDAEPLAMADWLRMKSWNSEIH